MTMRARPHQKVVICSASTFTGPAPSDDYLKVGIGSGLLDYPLSLRSSLITSLMAVVLSGEGR